MHAAATCARQTPAAQVQIRESRVQSKNSFTNDLMTKSHRCQTTLAFTGCEKKEARNSLIGPALGLTILERDWVTEVFG
jgi:hypothetical protein